MFGSSQKCPLQKTVKRCQLSVCLCLCIYMCVCIGYVYKPVEADVPKLSRVHIGHKIPKINDATVVY